MGRSYQASPAGLEKLKTGFEKYGKDQQYLANAIECTRQTVNKCLTGKPITKSIFINLCNELKLEWRDIAKLETEEGCLNPVNIPQATNKNAISVKDPKTKTIVTYITITGQFVIKIPGDINGFLQNREQQDIWLESVKRISGDENAAIDKIEKGSVKINFNISSEGIQKLEQQQDKIALVVRIISRNKGEKLDLSDTNLSDTNLSNTNLSGIDLSCADLRNTRLENANLNNVDFNCADLSGANLSNAHLEGAYLHDAVIDANTIIDEKWHRVWEIINNPSENKNLIGANLSSANLSSANLRCADLIGANLSSANLSGANLSGSNLSGANLSGANLFGSNFFGADLGGADLSGANLSGVNLSGANLRRANLRRANLRRANLSYATVKNAQFGYNPGMTEDAKRDLKQRGAIFEDSPGNKSKVPTF